MMWKCRSRDGLCFSGTNLGGTKKKKNLQSFGAAAVSASLLASLSVYKSLFHLVFLCIICCSKLTGCPKKNPQKTPTSSCGASSVNSVFLLTNQFLPKGYQHQATTTKTGVCRISTFTLDMDFLPLNKPVQLSHGLILKQ